MDRRTYDAFKNLLKEIEFELEHGSEIVKEKLSHEKFSQKEVIGILNGTLDNTLEKLSQDDLEGRNEIVEEEMDDHFLANMNGVGHDLDEDASINGGSSRRDEIDYALEGEMKLIMNVWVGGEMKLIVLLKKVRHHKLNHVIDFDECDSGDKGNDEQQLNNINIRLKQIRRAYKGRCNIRGGEFFVGQEFGTRKQVTQRVRILTVEARRALKFLECDKHKFREKCFGTLKGKCGTKEVLASPTRESDIPSTSNDKEVFANLFGSSLKDGLRESVEKVDTMKVAQKAKIKWSNEGDENSKYYHGVINNKRGRLTIRGVLVDGIWMEIPHLVKHEFFEYFKNRFEKRNKSRILLERDFVKRISLEQNDDLERRCLIRRLKGRFGIVVLIKHPSRMVLHLVSIDGIGTLLVTMLLMLSNGFFAWRDPERRPISLIGSLYKVIAKVLENRLVTVLDDIVDEIQSAFLTDGQILDGPFILNEIVHWCKNKKKQSMIFKVDFEKAYDSISHLFYADDAIFMGQWSQCNIDTIIRVLDVFYRASGLRINMNKSNLMGMSVDSNKASPSPNFVPASPDYVSESDPSEDPSKDDSPSDDVSKTAGLEGTHDVDCKKEGMCTTFPFTGYLGSSSSAQLSPYSGPSHRRSRYVSSSSETSHPSSSPPPRKRRRVLAYSSSSASLPPSPYVKPSRKRYMSPTPPLLVAEAVSTPPIEMLPPRKRFMSTSFSPQEDVHGGTTVKARLDDYNEMIGEMYVHLLDIPSTRLDDTKHELETLRARVREKIARDRISELENRLGYAEYWIQQGELARNSHVKTDGLEATEVYCLRKEIQKMENELWNLTVKAMHCEVRYCKRVDHMTRVCRTPVLAITQRALVVNQKDVVTYYECRKQGHYRMKRIVRFIITLESEHRGRCFKPKGMDKAVTSSSLSYDNDLNWLSQILNAQAGAMKEENVKEENLREFLYNNSYHTSIKAAPFEVYTVISVDHMSIGLRKDPNRRQTSLHRGTCRNHGFGDQASKAKLHPDRQREYIGLTDARLNGDACIGSWDSFYPVPCTHLSSNIKSMENALEKMVASLDAPSVATMSTIINKFAEEVKVKPDISALMKCTSAVHQMTYGCVPDSLDEYLQRGATTACDSLRIFWMNNDVKVLRQSLLFNDLKSGRASDVPFVANDGANDHKRILYKIKHEAARKDVERAFGVLKKKWKIIKYPARGLTQSRLSDIMYTCLILYNMIIHDKGKAICTDYFPEEHHRADDPVFERHIHALLKFLVDVMNPDNLLPLAYSFKDRVDPDVNDDTNEDELRLQNKSGFSILQSPTTPGCNRVATDGTEIQYVGSIVIDFQVENMLLLQNMLNIVICMAVDMWTCLIEERLAMQVQNLDPRRHKIHEIRYSIGLKIFLR
uniref:RNA-directed DNA polymerase, eukaryota, reverse transcriptase zinc-binding domain protein n=1 Tax=Tanacetum cinerariifolium TaxID=118510 RepID=A0A6L2MPC2_TANCI|nr:RNA-directed DNA polymerase, eukaryota, reverse transcriptase zinc-binding domain protein [Tanacetum cinerariifolium]